jgi:hypothetical protein
MAVVKPRGGVVVLMMCSVSVAANKKPVGHPPDGFCGRRQQRVGRGKRTSL